MRTFLLLSFLSFNWILLSQNLNREDILFQLADKKYNNLYKELKDSTQIYHALETYSKIIDSFPNSKYKFESLFQKANIYKDLGKYSEAKSIYLSLLKEKIIPSYSENNSINTDYYKNFSLINLGYIAVYEKDYDLALKYFNDSKNYKVRFGCGMTTNEHLKYIDSLIEAVNTLKN